MKSTQVPLKRSAPSHPRGAKKSKAPANLKEEIQVTVVVRPRRDDKAAAIETMSRQLPHERRYMDPDEFEQAYGAAPEDLESVARFAGLKGLSVAGRSSARHCVVLSGSRGTFRKAFGVEFTRLSAKNKSYHSYKGRVQIPMELDGVVQAVLGLDDRALTVHHAFMSRQAGGKHTKPRKVARQYEFPAVRSGKGQSIGIIENGGGFYRRDLHAYWKQQNCKPPEVRVVNIQGATNQPAPVAAISTYWNELQRRLQTGESLGPPPYTGDADLDAQVVATIECTLDVELAAAFAPIERLAVYFNDGSDQGLYHAFTTAIHDKKNRPSAISYSWGDCEGNVTPSFVNVMESVHQSAAILGVTLCCSSGDSGDGQAACGQVSVNYPASSPYVLGCGGTHLLIPNNRETVWNEQLNNIDNATTGGVSALFTTTPSWQASAHVQQKTGAAGRGVPDVASKADLIFGYCMLVGGRDIAMGGTSAAAPLWASLIALINRKLGVRVGYLTPLLYTGPRGMTRQITQGNNGIYHASPGWNPCTGWGSPNGKALLAALAGP